MATIKDVAREAGVSVATESRLTGYPLCAVVVIEPDHGEVSTPFARPALITKSIECLRSNASGTSCAFACSSVSFERPDAMPVAF